MPILIFVFSSGFGQYERGVVQQVKQPEVVSFKPMPLAMKVMEPVVTDFAKFEAPGKVLVTLHFVKIHYVRGCMPWFFFIRHPVVRRGNSSISFITTVQPKNNQSHIPRNHFKLATCDF